MRIQILGGVRIHADTTVDLPPSTGCVLAALALNFARPMTVSALANHLWHFTEQTDRSPGTVRDYLRRLKAAIKQAGGDPGCLRNHQGTDIWTLELHKSQVDYHHFVDRAAAARQHRNPALFQEALNLWPEHARALAGIEKNLWAQLRRDELQAERRDLHLDLLALQLDAGEHAAVVDALNGVLDQITPTDQVLLLGATALARDAAIPTSPAGLTGSPTVCALPPAVQRLPQLELCKTRVG